MVAEGGDPAGVQLFPAPFVRGRRGLDALARSPVQDDWIAGFFGGHARSDLEHGAGGFVTEQVGQEICRGL